jgi:pimeloyl-ACP methyl ester carboxylesterase
MSKRTFDVSKWFQQKVNKKKDSLIYFSEKFAGIIREFKEQLNELKDDSHHMVPIINGLFGDKMQKNGHPALVTMSFRHNSRDISVENLDAYCPLQEHGGNLVLFVHGLMNDETIWKSNPEDLVQRTGSFVENQKRGTILYLRYNTGRHISENGRDLSFLLEKLVQYYPSKINSLTLVCHSMGGLVGRSAGYYAQYLGHRWVSLLKKVFLIGVPNEGSYLARIAHMTQYFLRKADPSVNDTIATLFDIRSNGIKDLSFGFLVDEDWEGTGYEKKKSAPATKVFPLEHVEYYLIAATVTKRSEEKRLFRFFGDGLVEEKSALSRLFIENKLNTGNVFFRLFETENHLTLLENEEIHSYILKCMEEKAC